MALVMFETEKFTPEPLRRRGCHIHVSISIEKFIGLETSGCKAIGLMER